jgi:broad specificity phosphatase PhoE
MTQITLVRHGQTDWNLARRYQGQMDIPLNEEGFRQARELSVLLADEVFDVIYSSDLQRARQTAEILQLGRHIPLITDQRLREIAFGQWEGAYFPDMLRDFPERFAISQKDPSISLAPGGESVLEVSRRTSAFADEISLLYPNGKILVVTHGMALATLLCAANGISLDQAFTRVPDNAQPIRICWEIEPKRK